MILCIDIVHYSLGGCVSTPQGLVIRFQNTSLFGVAFPALLRAVCPLNLARPQPTPIRYGCFGAASSLNLREIVAYPPCAAGQRGGAGVPIFASSRLASCSAQKESNIGNGTSIAFRFRATLRPYVFFGAARPLMNPCETVAHSRETVVYNRCHSKGRGMQRTNKTNAIVK